MDWKKIDFSFVAELPHLLLIFVSIFVGIPALMYAMFSQGDWAAGISMIGLLALPAITFALWAKGAPERVVRIAVFVTIAAIPLFLGVEVRAFMK